MMSFSKASVQVELDRFFKSYAQSSDSFETISRSAFTQSRKKLLPSAFTELADEQLSYFQNHAPHQKTWKGHRLIAIDGSQINVPNGEALKQHFGTVANQHEIMNRARCSFAYDICNELIVDSKIVAHKSCEKELAVSHLSKLNPATDILIFDRGYPCLWLMGLLVEKGFKFCFRLSTAWKDAVDLMNSPENDVEWTSTRRSKRDLGNHKTYNISTTIKGLRLSKIKLSTGEYEILATHLLDKVAFDLNSLKELYNKRWGVEEAYKLFKKSIHIEYFTGKTVRAIEQDFYAKVLMLNLSSMIRTQYIEAQKPHKKENKHETQANKTQVLAKTKDYLIELFYQTDISQILEQIKKVLLKCFDIVRPNRSFERPNTSSRRRHKSLNYKGI